MAWLRNCWYVAMWAQDLKAGALESRTIIGENIVLYRCADGSIAALQNRCPHRFAPLHMGKLGADGCTLRCGYHGLEFGPDGQCVGNPHGEGRIPPALAVKSYAAVEKHSLVWVWMGDRTPNEAAIPDYSLLDAADQSTTSARDCLQMDVDYRLIVDNLLDLSHVSFLHDGILGNEETIRADIQAEERDDTVTVSRYMPDVPPPELFDMLFRRDGRRVDLWASMRWNAPACLLNDAGVKAVGDERRNGTGIFGIHILTPQTERSTLYHFAAVRQNPIAFPPDEAQGIARRLTELRRYAFAEQDEPMIRAQQAVIDGAVGPLEPVLLPIDVGPVRYKRILERLIQQEALPHRA